MKSIHDSEGKAANHIEYQPIIDGDQNDPAQSTQHFFNALRKKTQIFQ